MLLLRRVCGGLPHQQIRRADVFISRYPTRKVFDSSWRQVKLALARRHTSQRPCSISNGYADHSEYHPQYQKAGRAHASFYFIYNYEYFHLATFGVLPVEYYPWSTYYLWSNHYSCRVLHPTYSVHSCRLTRLSLSS